MKEAVVAAVLVAQVIVHLVQKALSGLDIVIFRQILRAGIVTQILSPCPHKYLSLGQNMVMILLLDDGAV
jgi:hypothetical protein